GLFRGVDPKRGLGLVNLDGESTWVAADAVLAPHPILFGDALDDWRQLATELAITQAISQLFRETFTRPAGLAPTLTTLDTWSGGHFAQLNFALGRCRTLGYRVRGGFATCPVREPTQDLAVVEARYWIGAEYPDQETLTGELLWVDAKERPLPVASVGPVALSEGIRMAAAIYAGRQVKEDAA
ncbi:MAG: DUF4132 domain-containing protein, partial [Deltaproteobacteria bacterium]|nr:DUF4132 domain-containing protein [Deltaproteobacteria bacterium]